MVELELETLIAMRLNSVLSAILTREKHNVNIFEYPIQAKVRSRMIY